MKTIDQKILDKLHDIYRALACEATSPTESCCPQTNTLLTDLKNLVQLTQDTFQVIDCNGDNVGTPQEVEKVVVLNKIITSLCNINELALEIENAKPLYNTMETIEVISSNSPYTVAPNYFHSIHIKAIGTSCKRNTGGILIDMEDGETFSYEVSTINTTPCTFEVSGSDKLIIDLIK